MKKMNDISIFELLFDDYKPKKVRLIELFAGFGSQNLSLKYLGANYEHYKICEWATKSIQAYNDLHIQDYTDYSKDMSKDEVISYLFNKGISLDYNKPMNLQEIKRKGESWQRQVYNNIIATNNLVNIQQVKGSDLEIVDTDKYDYLMTYSFPCQDLSLAGKGKGMADTSTRSGMLWEVERILDECYKLGSLPQILLMENVTQVVGTKNIKHFQKWRKKLEDLGYQSYVQNMIATEYGIPQTRDRTFMLSILGSYNYTFPNKMPLKYRLKNLLENDVDESCYLSDKMINFFKSNEEKQKEKGNGFKFNVSDGDCIAKTITTRAGSRMDYNFITVPEATKKGYAEAYEGDSVNLEQPNSKTRRGRVGKGVAQTLLTSCNQGVVQKDNYVILPKEDRTNLESYFVSEKGCKYILDPKRGMCTDINADVAQPLTAKGQHNWTGSFVSSDIEQIERSKTIGGKEPTKIFMKNGDVLLYGGKEKVLQNDLRIRKLTPKECFRLMGVKDEDFENIAKNQSNSSLYHLAGDSIVSTVLMAILGKLLGIDYEQKINELLEELAHKNEN